MKYKEFWLEDNVPQLMPVCYRNKNRCPIFRQKDLIHVIDYAAYAALEAKLAYYKDHAEMIKEQWDAVEAKLAECVDVISYLGANVLLLHAGNCPAAYSHENLFELCNCHVFKAAKFLAKVKK